MPLIKFIRIKLSADEKHSIAMKRRARQLGCPVVMHFTRKDVIDRDGLNCYLCGELLTIETITIDHVVPLSRGGFHCLSNVRIACDSCNSAKNNKLLEEYLQTKA